MFYLSAPFSFWGLSTDAMILSLSLSTFQLTQVQGSMSSDLLEDKGTMKANAAQHWNQ